MRHLVRQRVQTEHRLAVVHFGEQDHKRNISRYHVQIAFSKIVVERDVEVNLTGVYGGEQVIDVVSQVEQVDKGVVVERERFKYVRFPVLQATVL